MDRKTPLVGFGFDQKVAAAGAGMSLTDSHPVERPLAVPLTGHPILDKRRDRGVLSRRTVPAFVCFYRKKKCIASENLVKNQGGLVVDHVKFSEKGDVIGCSLSLTVR